MRRRSGRKVDISLWDHVKLKHELMSRPAFVLRHFGACQVESLDQLACFLEIRRDHPEAAARIVAAAAGMGIPERLGLGDVLCDRPGEV